MAHRYLGRQLDIHTGGVDHIPVHHENELAQAENVLGVSPWVGTWLHGEWLVMHEQKLSKSSGAAPTLDDVLARGLSPEAFRWFLLGAHYRQKLTFSWDALEAAQQSVARLRRVARLPAAEGVDTRAWRQRLLEALGDDLATPRALALVWDAARSTELSEAERASVVRELTTVLGIPLDHAETPAFADAQRAQIEGLVSQREQARSRRDFARADALRAQLLSLGVVVEDAVDGPRYRRARAQP
jgi:cysteinyl-tRNA synthetase